MLENKDYDKITSLMSSLKRLMDDTKNARGIDPSIDIAVSDLVVNKVKVTIKELGRGIRDQHSSFVKVTDNPVKAGDMLKVLADSAGTFEVGSVHECVRVDNRGWPWIYSAIRNCEQTLLAKEYEVVAKVSSEAELKVNTDDQFSAATGKWIKSEVTSPDARRQPVTGDWIQVECDIWNSLPRGTILQVKKAHEDGYTQVVEQNGAVRVFCAERFTDGELIVIPAP